MKRIIAVILLGLMLLSSASAFAIVGQYEIVVNGKATRAMAVMDDGTLMVPMKAVCKALGYKITYKSSDKAYHIENGTNACDIAMDSSVYTVYAVNGMAGTTSPTDLGSEPKLISGTTYIPAELIKVLLGNSSSALKTEGEVLYISSAGDKKKDNVKPDNNSEKTYRVKVNGRRVSGRGRTVEGTIMVPLKSVAKALGYKVSYKSASKAYHVQNGTNACDIAMDSSVYTVYAVNGMAGTTSPTDLGAEPQYIGKTLYVPVELFRVLLGNYDEAVTVSGSYILIREVSIGCATPNA